MQASLNHGLVLLVSALLFSSACGSRSTLYIDAGSGGASTSGTGAAGASTTTTATATATTTTTGTGGGPSGLCSFARGYGSPVNQFLTRMQFDNTGAIVLTGMFFNTIDFGGLVLDSGDETYSNATGGAVFVAKLNEQGQPLWARQYGPIEPKRTAYSALDGAGNIVVGTTAKKLVDFGAGPMVSLASPDAFLAKLSPDGQTLWSRRAVEQANQTSVEIGALEADAAGNILVAGTRTSGKSYVFLSRIDPNGNTLWSHDFLWAGPYVPLDDLAVDADGSATLLVNLYSGGKIVLFDMGSGPMKLPDETNAFVVRFDPSGNVVYARLLDKAFASGDENWYANGRLLAAPPGDVYFVDIFRGTLDFGTGPIQVPGEGTILARLDAAGNTKLAHAYPGGAEGERLALSADGRLYIGGILQGSATFGNDTISWVDKKAGGFLAEVDASTGEALNARSYGPGQGYITHLEVRPSGQIVVAGSLQGELDVCDLHLTGSGDEDFFVAQVAP